MFTKAIVRVPNESLVKGITTANIGTPDFTKAIKQHNEYVEALEVCQLSVIKIDTQEQYPDSVFIEDTAVVTKEFAIITNPQPETRKGEIEKVKEVLANEFKNIHCIKEPATLEGGDVMLAGNRFYIGITDRTIKEGVEEFSKIVKEYGFSTIAIEVEDMLHLKTGMSYLENNNLLIVESLSKHPSFKDFYKIIVDRDEEYAANSLWINGYVLIPDGFPKTREKIEKYGYETIVLHMNEFRKVDGGLSCLSLRF